MSWGLSVPFFDGNHIIYLTITLVNLNKIRKLHVKLGFQEFVFQ